MTKREMFTTIMSFDVIAENAEIMDFLKHEIELLDARKGGTRKPTKTQLENEGIKDTIYEVLLENSDKPMRVKDLVEDERLSEYSSSKITALLRQMLPADEKNPKGEGRVTRTVEKKVAYFSVGD